jgi:hypothetical protein
MQLGDFSSSVTSSPIPPTKTPGRLKIYYFISDDELSPGDVVISGRQTTISPGVSNKIAILSLIDKYRSTPAKFEDMIHVHCTPTEPETWHGDSGSVYEAICIGSIITVDIRWLVQLETWYALLKPENFNAVFRKALDANWLNYIHKKIEKILTSFWDCKVFDEVNYNQSKDEKKLSFKNVTPGPLPPEYQMVLANQIKIIRKTNETV